MKRQGIRSTVSCSVVPPNYLRRKARVYKSIVSSPVVPSSYLRREARV